MTMPQDGDDSEAVKNLKVEHKNLLIDMKDLFGQYTYVLDFNTYAPVYDREFKNQYYLGNHMNPAGYVQTARMVESYIEDGCQKIGENIYGKSITDPCLGWEKTERLILDIASLI